MTNDIARSVVYSHIPHFMELYDLSDVQMCRDSKGITITEISFEGRIKSFKVSYKKDPTEDELPIRVEPI